MINKNLKILITEDEVTLRKVLTDIISQSGFSVIEAGDGNEGLEKAFSMHPDIILLNILMPGMDGLTMLEKLREDDWGKSVPVIVLTNVEPKDEELQKIADYRAAYYMIKTKTNLEQVVEKIRELLQ